MARNSYQRRVAKLADAGFIKEKDYRKYTKSKADKLRRLEPHYEKLRRYFRDGQYQIAQVSKQRRKALDWIQPREVRRWKLPYLLLFTGKTQGSDKKVRPNEIKSIRQKGSEVVITTTGPKIRIPRITAREFARNPEQAIQAIIDKMGPRSRVRLSLGLRTSYAAYNANTFAEYMPQFLNTYIGDDGGPNDYEDFLEGLHIIDL